MADTGLRYRFGDFLLDVPNRQLWRDGETAELSGRYFDALVLLVREHGQLVEKERFFSEVWEDVVVSDSALTQCIKDVRKLLGDDASKPRFIETVPRYGYRFIAPVEAGAAGPITSGSPIEPTRPPSAVASPAGDAWDGAQAGRRPESKPHRSAPFFAAPPVREAAALRNRVRWSGAGTLGGGVAGLLGGLLYGSALSYLPGTQGLGTASILVVLLSLNVLVGLIGGFGVSVGMATWGWLRRQRGPWNVAGAALGGLLIGGAAKLLGTDAFQLLFGHAPPGITGGIEGAVLGAALVLGVRGARRLRPGSVRALIVGAGLAGAAAGALIAAGGGHLMGGSLDSLARSFADSQLRLDTLGRFFGEVHFGFTTQVILSSIEGLLFCGCVAGAIVLSRPATERSEDGSLTEANQRSTALA